VSMPIEIRFWSKVDIRSDEDCWMWLASVVRHYGQFEINVNGAWKPAKAHRVAWELSHGCDVPAGLLICHTCDIPLCVNPRHLYVGTDLDNMHDKMARGRWRGGRTAKTMIGALNPMFRKHHTAAARVLMRRNRTSTVGSLNPMFGKHHTAEAKRKISLARRCLSHG
jgi:hypothetical protein